MKTKAPLAASPFQEVKSTLEPSPAPTVGRQRFLLALICIAVLFTILTLGLWPFHSPRNEVTWLENRNGVRFGSHGTIISSKGIGSETSINDNGESLEVWLQPRRAWGGGTLMSFYGSAGSSRASVQQSLSDLELNAENDHAGRVHFYVPEVFRRTGPLFITLTSGAQGTAVYAQGILTLELSNFRLPRNAFAGKVVAGDSPGQSDTWSGQLFGVAVYHHDLAASQVYSHYQAWTQLGRPQINEGERNVALYLFDEHNGNVVHNRAAAGADLFIPQKYEVLDQTFLEPVWSEFRMSESYWANAVKNVVGFIPLGFCSYAYFTSFLRTGRATVLTVILGFAVSLAIEVLQASLPTRDSGTTDIITNTFGTWIGLALYRPRFNPVLTRFIPQLLRPNPRN